jgi:ribosomal protein S27AE
MPVLKKNPATENETRCPACNMGVLADDGDGEYCGHCLYTTDPRMTIEAAVAKAEAVALAESRILREKYTRQKLPQIHRRRAA